MAETFEWFKVCAWPPQPHPGPPLTSSPQTAVQRHSIQRPPFAEAVFSLPESERVLDYGLRTYFRHFALYKYNFTSEPRLDLKLNFPGDPAPEPEAEPEPTPAPAPEAEAEVEPEAVPAEPAEPEPAAEPEAEVEPEAERVAALLSSQAGKALKSLVEAQLESSVSGLRGEIEGKLKAQADELSSTVTSLEAKLAP